MKIALESTDKLTYINGLQVRVWTGRTESGVSFLAYIPIIAVDMTGQAAHPVAIKEFQDELIEKHPHFPDDRSIPLNMIV